MLKTESSAHPKVVAIVWSGVASPSKSTCLEETAVVALPHELPQQFLLCGALGEQILISIPTSRQENLVSYPKPPFPLQTLLLRGLGALLPFAGAEHKVMQPHPMTTCR